MIAQDWDAVDGRSKALNRGFMRSVKYDSARLKKRRGVAVSIYSILYYL